MQKNNSIISCLSIEQRFDIASMLCESGNYKDAVYIAKACLASNQTLFRSKQYLRLAHVLCDDKNYMSSIDPDESSYITELGMCFEHIKNSRKTIEDIFKRNKRKVKVIGNSPNQRGIKRGGEINQANIVVRFNSFDTSLNRRADIGSKTDIWVKSPSFEEVSRKTFDNFKAVIITGTNHMDRSPSAYDFFYDFYKAGIPVTCIPNEVYHDLSKKISSPPSGGMQVLYWLKELNGKLTKNEVYGFSLTTTEALKGPNGERNQKISYSHDWNKEIIIIKNECMRVK